MEGLAMATVSEQIKSGRPLEEVPPRRVNSLSNNSYAEPQRRSIDIYRDEIANARESGDAERILEIAEIFYGRIQAEEHVDFELNEAYFGEDECDLFLHIGDFLLKIVGVGYKNATMELSDATGKDAGSIHWEARIVEALGVPHSYILGIAAGIRCATETFFVAPEKILQCKYESVAGNESRYAEAALRRLTGRIASEILATQDTLRTKQLELSQLELQIKQKQKKASDRFNLKAIQKCITARTTTDYPPVPVHASPRDIVSKNLKGQPGVYVARRDGIVSYVGKSKDVGSRLSNHEKVDANDLVSVITMEESEIHVSELWYIATLRPFLNKELQEEAAVLKRGQQ
jgi:hypothetical protein